MKIANKQGIKLGHYNKDNEIYGILPSNTGEWGYGFVSEEVYSVRPNHIVAGVIRSFNSI